MPKKLRNMPEKPSYFDCMKNLDKDSEDEMIPGENNYIKIKGMPLTDEVSKEEERKRKEEEERKKKAEQEERKKMPIVKSYLQNEDKSI